MTKPSSKSIRLTDAQLVVLSQAVQREDRRIVPPAHLKGAALSRVMRPLLAKGLIVEEQPRSGQAGAEADARYIIADAGFGALGIELGAGVAGVEAGACQSDQCSEEAGGVNVDGGSIDPAAISLPVRTAAHVSGAGIAPRAGSKLAMVVALLRRPEGASIEALMAATGWLPHTTRAALTSLRKRGMMVLRDKVSDGSSRYCIVEAGAEADGEAPVQAAAGDDQAGLADDVSTAAGRTGYGASASAISDDRAAA